MVFKHLLPSVIKIDFFILSFSFFNVGLIFWSIQKFRPFLQFFLFKDFFLRMLELSCVACLIIVIRIIRVPSSASLFSGIDEIEYECFIVLFGC